MHRVSANWVTGFGNGRLPGEEMCRPYGAGIILAWRPRTYVLGYRMLRLRRLAIEVDSQKLKVKSELKARFRTFDFEL